MSIGLLFWILMILWFVFGLYWHWPHAPNQPPNFPVIGGHVLLFILFFLLGWKVFGFVLQGA